MISEKRDQAVVSVLELKRLLVELAEKRPNVCIRPRLMGEMWLVHFMRVVSTSEKGVLLHDEETNRFISVSDLSYIMQFELDNRFQNYQPHFHYEVRVSPSEFQT
jgi:hypothetical protein